MHLEVELTKPPRWNCRYFVQLSYSSFTIRTGRTLVLAKAIDWHIALTQAGPKFMSPHEFAAFKQNLLIKRVQLYNANSFAPPFSQCLLEMLFFFNQSFSSFWRHVARLLEWFLFERGCLSADGGSSLCSFARGRLSSPDHGRVEAIVTAAWPNWQSPLTTKKKDPFWKGQWAKHRITALVNKYKLWILGAFLRSEPEISLSFRSSFSSKLGTVYSPTSRILEMAVSMWHGLIWRTVCSTRWEEKWLVFGIWGDHASLLRDWKVRFLYMQGGWLPDSESHATAHSGIAICAVYQSEQLRQHRFRTFVKRSGTG